MYIKNMPITTLNSQPSSALPTVLLGPASGPSGRRRVGARHALCIGRDGRQIPELSGASSVGGDATAGQKSGPNHPDSV